MSGNGVVSIPAGVTQKAAFLLVDGTPLPKGDYSYALAKDEGVKAHFDPDAAGVLRVLGDGKGTVIMFK